MLRHGLGHAGGLARDLEQRLELGAHAGAEELVVVHDQYARLGQARSSSSSTSVPDPGALEIVARPPWRRMRPTIDSRTPRRSDGTAAGSKPGPRSRTNTFEPLRRHLGEHVHGRAAAELGGVRHGLAGRSHHGLGGRVERRVAHRHHLDRHAVVLLHLGGGRLERGAQAGGLAGRGPAREPGAQLALLAPRERGHLARLVGAALHHRERLEHRVVEVRSHLGALLRADPLGALGSRASAPGG